MSSVGSGAAVVRVPIIVPLTTLVLADEIARVEIMQACSVEATSGMISGSLRLLSSGTFTVLVKNDAAATVATLTWSAAGLQNATPSATNFAAGDHLHLNITSAGTVPVDCVITIWLKLT